MLKSRIWSKSGERCIFFIFRSFPGYYTEIEVFAYIWDGCRRNENPFWNFSSLLKNNVGKSNDFIGAFRHRVKAIFTHCVAHWSEMPNLIHFLFLMKYCLDMTSKHTTGLLRCQGFQKKYKRPTKVVKAKPKAREPMMWKI